MSFTQIPKKLGFPILIFALLFGTLGSAGIKNEIIEKGLFCEDGLSLCEYLDHDRKFLLKSGPGSFYFRESDGTLFAVYLGSDGVLRLMDLKHHTNQSLAELTRDFHDKLKKPVKTKGLCKPGLNELTQKLSSLSTTFHNIAPKFCFQEPSENPQKPFYCYQDSVFRDDRTLKIKGGTITEELAQDRTQAVLDSLQLKQSQLHGAQLFHGSSSASLIAFTEYNDKEGALVPLGILENEKKKIAFSGEIVWGRTGVNSHSLSTTWAGALRGALDYTHSRNWDPKKGRKSIEEANTGLKESIRVVAENKNIDPLLRRRYEESLNAGLQTGDFQEFKKTLKITQEVISKLDDQDHSLWARALLGDINLREVNEKRLKEWETLTGAEKSLIAEPFRVLFGIRSDRADDIQPVFAAIPGEIAIRGGAHRDEIRVVFVPEDKIEFVKKLLTENGHPTIAVEPIPAKSGFLKAR